MKAYNSKTDPRRVLVTRICDDVFVIVSRFRFRTRFAVARRTVETTNRMMLCYNNINKTKDYVRCFYTRQSRAFLHNNNNNNDNNST